MAETTEGRLLRNEQRALDDEAGGAGAAARADPGEQHQRPHGNALRGIRGTGLSVTGTSCLWPQPLKDKSWAARHQGQSVH